MNRSLKEEQFDPEYPHDHPRNLIPELCRHFYDLGWATGSGKLFLLINPVGTEISTPRGSPHFNYRRQFPRQFLSLLDNFQKSKRLKFGVPLPLLIKYNLHKKCLYKY